MEKVYLVIKVNVDECEEEVTVVGVYGDKAKAQRKFKSEVKTEKEENQWWNEEEPDYEDFLDTDTEFCCWESGYFSQNHVYITLEEQKVK